MTQTELERAVARATGESVAAVRRLGFQLEEIVSEDFDDEDGAAMVDEGPRVLDWDDREAVYLNRYLSAAA